jgi:hypothetical protein
LAANQESGFPGKFPGYLSRCARSEIRTRRRRPGTDETCLAFVGAARRAVTKFTEGAIESCGAEFANVQFPGMNAATYSHSALSALARVLAIIRLPIVAGLLLLEPVVNVVCGAAAVLGILVAAAFELSAAGPRFPFLQVAAISFACGLLLIL